MDDIADESITRRGKPCWYRQEDVKLMALNDASFLYTSMYILLKHYFGQNKCYIDMFDLISKVI